MKRVVDAIEEDYRATREELSEFTAISLQYSVFQFKRENNS